ncbi:MAG: hypothetical protein WC457_02400 [Patescibacteria group bacterium]
MRSFKKIVVWFVYQLVIIIGALCVSSVPIAIGLAIFIWIYATEQPVWISAPWSIIAALAVILPLFGLKNKNVAVMPMSLEEFFLRHMD